MEDLLFLSQRLPYPPNKGDKIRSYHVLRDLSRHYRVHLGCFIDDDADWQHVPTIEKMVTSLLVLPLNKRIATLRSLPALGHGLPLTVPYYYDRRMADWVRSLIACMHPAAAYLFSSPMAQYVLNGPRPERIVMDFVDVDSQKWGQYADSRPWPMAAIYRREARTLLNFERVVAHKVDAGIFVSEPEKDLFASLAPEAKLRLHAIGNGTDAGYFSPIRNYAAPFDTKIPTLVFTGAMDYWPNIEAVAWFANQVLPRLKMAVANVQLMIVGLNPTAEVLALGKIAGVTVTGRVPDVRPYLAHATAVIAPLLTARGVQNKVLEAMAMARPVVVTSQALEGIEAEPNLHLLAADGVENFAKATLRAMTDPRSATMGWNARRQILARYGWESQLARFRSVIAPTQATESASAPARVGAASPVSLVVDRFRPGASVAA